MPHDVPPEDPGGPWPVVLAATLATEQALRPHAVLPGRYALADPGVLDAVFGHECTLVHLPATVAWWICQCELFLPGGYSVDTAPLGFGGEWMDSFRHAIAVARKEPNSPAVPELVHDLLMRHPEGGWRLVYGTAYMLRVALATCGSGPVDLVRAVQAVMRVGEPPEAGATHDELMRLVALVVMATVVPSRRVAAQAVHLLRPARIGPDDLGRAAHAAGLLGQILAEGAQAGYAITSVARVDRHGAPVGVVDLTRAPAPGQDDELTRRSQLAYRVAQAVGADGAAAGAAVLVEQAGTDAHLYGNVVMLLAAMVRAYLDATPAPHDAT